MSYFHEVSVIMTLPLIKRYPRLTIVIGHYDTFSLGTNRALHNYGIV